MSWRWYSVAGVALGVAANGCATRQATSQVLTVAGAAAVIVGASMAADSNCYDTGEGAVEPFCSSHLSKGARNVGKGVAVAGVGLAAAGYALAPKGPDRMAPRPSDPAARPSPYRLIRHDPPPEVPSPEALPPESGAGEGGAQVGAAEASPGSPLPEAPSTNEASSQPTTTCRPESSATGAPPCVPERIQPTKPSDGAAADPSAR